MPAVSFNTTVVVLVLGTLALMGTQAIPQGWPRRRTTLAVLAVVGFGCVFAGFAGLAEHAAR